jgi:hypothetical protein
MEKVKGIENLNTTSRYIKHYDHMPEEDENLGKLVKIKESKYGLTPELIFENGRSHAGDCGVVPYRDGSYNPTNWLEEIKED